MKTLIAKTRDLMIVIEYAMIKCSTLSLDLNFRKIIVLAFQWHLENKDSKFCDYKET